MKVCLVTIVSLGAALGVDGCTSEPSRPVDGFPVGMYTRCAQGVYNPSGNAFVNAAGFESSAMLTLAQSETDVVSMYVDQNGTTQSLGFSATSSTSATLAGNGQVIPGFTSLC